MAEVHPRVAALSKKYVLKNIGTSKLIIHANSPVAGEPLALKPGETVILTGFQAGTVYANAIEIFRNYRPAPKLELAFLEEQEPETTKASEPVEPPANSEDSEKGEDRPTDAYGSPEEVQAAVVRLKADIKGLESEYKSKGTSAARKQDIKEEIRELRLALKSLK